MFDFYIDKNGTPTVNIGILKKFLFKKECPVMSEQSKTKTFKIIGDGIMLYFSKAFDAETKGLKKKIMALVLEGVSI